MTTVVKLLYPSFYFLSSLPPSFSFHFPILWISVCLPPCVCLLKMVSALLLLHQKAVAKWRLTSAAATEEGLCVFSSWGQIPLKMAKLWSSISHFIEEHILLPIITDFEKLWSLDSLYIVFIMELYKVLSSYGLYFGLANPHLLFL